MLRAKTARTSRAGNPPAPQGCRSAKLQQLKCELAALGQRLAMARERKGLTVAECCNRLGVDPDAWQRWESGQEAPPVDTGCQAAKLLAVETELIADGEGAILRT